ncbi:hypothetical protein E4U55_002899 [Claviceps digitariae]|nr:hypothetical protein E4U55_002899 [Claviceps digitariae]
MSSPGKASYSLTIRNKNSLPQSYSLINHPPQVKPTPEDLVPHALLVARLVPALTGTATLVIQSDCFYAICGTMYQDEAAKMYVMDRQSVSLGSRPRSGVAKSSGTTAVLNVESGSLSFRRWNGPGDDAGNDGAFCLQTEKTFTLEEAKNNRYMAGFGLKTCPNAHVGIHASFTPAPNTPYQITPSKIYYLTATPYATNEPQPADFDLSTARQIDFAQLPPHVVITHENSSLDLTTEPSPLSPNL